MMCSSDTRRIIASRGRAITRKLTHYKPLCRTHSPLSALIKSIPRSLVHKGECPRHRSSEWRSPAVVVHPKKDLLSADLRSSRSPKLDACRHRHSVQKTDDVVLHGHGTVIAPCRNPLTA